MSGYYPPGVTGNEPEIAGYPEGTWHGECQAQDYPIVPAWEVEASLWHIRHVLITKPTTDVIEAIGDLTSSIRGTSRREGDDCGWEGDVDAVFTSDTVCWTCPRCGTEHEDERPIPERDEYEEDR